MPASAGCHRAQRNWAGGRRCERRAGRSSAPDSANRKALQPSVRPLRGSRAGTAGGGDTKSVSCGGVFLLQHLSNTLLPTTVLGWQWESQLGGGIPISKTQIGEAAQIQVLSWLN